MDSNEPCGCGSKSKRYTSSTNEWVCNKCKKRTLDYTHQNAFIKVQCRDWWNFLPEEKKIELYLKDKSIHSIDKGTETTKL